MSWTTAVGRMPFVAFGAGRFEFYLHPSLFGVLLVVGLLACVLAGRGSWAVGAGAAVGYAAILVLHEAGHAATAALLGARRIQVWLGGGGGLCVAKLPAGVGLRGRLLHLSAGWGMQLGLAGVGLLLMQAPSGPWSPAVTSLVLAWLPLNGVLLLRSLLPHGRSDGAQVLAALRQAGAGAVNRSG